MAYGLREISIKTYEPHEGFTVIPRDRVRFTDDHESGTYTWLVSLRSDILELLDGLDWSIVYTFKDNFPYPAVSRVTLNIEGTEDKILMFKLSLL